MTSLRTSAWEAKATHFLTHFNFTFLLCLAHTCKVTLSKGAAETDNWKIKYRIF